MFLTVIFVSSTSGSKMSSASTASRMSVVLLTGELPFRNDAADASPGSPSRNLVAVKAMVPVAVLARAMREARFACSHEGGPRARREEKPRLVRENEIFKAVRAPAGHPGHRRYPHQPGQKPSSVQPSMPAVSG